MKQDWAALGSVLFLIGVFAISFVLLQRSIRKAYTGNSSNNQGNRRVLNDEERVRVAQRLEREAQRERRELERIRQQEAYEIAKPSAYAEKIRKREEERVIREAEELREKREREARESVEYEKWKSQIQVTERGEDHEAPDQSLIQEFVDCLRVQKIIMIEDLAAKFNLSTQTVVDRITDLIQQGIVTGCFDDRGRYIPINGELIDRIEKCLDTLPERIQVTAIQLIVNEALGSH